MKQTVAPSQKYTMYFPGIIKIIVK